MDQDLLVFDDLFFYFRSGWPEGHLHRGARVAGGHAAPPHHEALHKVIKTKQRHILTRQVLKKEPTFSQFLRMWAKCVIFDYLAYNTFKFCSTDKTKIMRT